MATSRGPWARLFGAPLFGARPGPASATPVAAEPLFPLRATAPVEDAIVPPLPTPASAGLQELADLAAGSVVVQAPGFWPGQRTRLVAAADAPAPRAPPLLDGTAAFAEEWLARWHEGDATPSHDVACYFASDAIVSGSGQVWFDGKLVVSPELMPRYVHSQHLGLPRDPTRVLRAKSLALRAIERPCVVLQGRMNVYGHFLIETLLQVLLIRRLLDGAGLRHGYLLPSATEPWLRAILHEDLGVSPRDIEFYDSERERIHLRHAILPADLHREHGFHPVARTLLADLLETLGPRLPPPRKPGRLFLARGDYVNEHTAARVCVNEAALVEHARSRHGFEPVAMQALPWVEQIALLRDAEIVLGQFGSALHGALFCPPGTRVAALGVANSVQSEIAALCGHRLGYCTRGIVLEGRFDVDEAAFARFLDAVCA